jgi:P4 family phage/plasmid primase-like protien
MWGKKASGAYFIPDDEMNTFHELYDRCLYENKKAGEIKIELNIIEKHKEYSPILIDIDERYSKEIVERQHTDEHIKKIVQLYQKHIKETFYVEEEYQLNAFVFQRSKSYESNGYRKDGIHIMFPHVVSSPNPQYHIRDNIIKLINPIVSDLPLHEKTTMADLVDKCVIHKNGWFLYGSTKPHTDVYEITNIYTSELKEIDPEKYEYDCDSISKFFSIRRFASKDSLRIREEKHAAINKIANKNSNNRRKRKLKVLENVDIDEIRQVVECFSDDRANNEVQWMEVGWALHNIDPNDQSLLDVWIEFSKRSPKFYDMKEGKCEKLWDKMKDHGLGIGSLYYFAKTDNYDKFAEIKSSSIQSHITRSIENVTNWGIAKVLFEMYKFQFKCSSAKRNVWYEFKDHRWMEMDQGIELRSKISNELKKEYCKLMSKCNNTASSDDIDEEDQESAKDTGKKLLDIISKLENTTFKDNIVKECKELFHDKDFMNRLDENPYLIGFENGIYDLQTMEFRDGRPDDYVTLSTGIDYEPFDQEHEYYEEMSRFIETVFPQENIREYFLSYLSTCLQGVNNEQKFRVWIGCGSNGKSKMEELFRTSFGEYCIKFSITLLCGKRAASNAPSPEVVQGKGKRFGYFEEPNEGEKMNAGLMKEYTGEDPITARGLQKDPITFIPQWKLALLCNDFPEVPPHDKATWRRIEAIEFTSEFCENPQEPNQFLIDMHLGEKMKNWRELFLSMLIDVYYRKYKKDGKLYVPDDIKKYTEEYHKQCDSYLEFMSQTIDETKDPLDSVNTNDLYDDFKLWYDDNFNSNRHPSKRDFMRYLEKKFSKKKMIGSELQGFRLKKRFGTPDQEEDEDD